MLLVLFVTSNVNFVNLNLTRVLCSWSFIFKCRVLNHVTWKLVAEHQHQHSVESPTAVRKDFKPFSKFD